MIYIDFFYKGVILFIACNCKDLINPDSSKEKIFIGVADLNEALTLADKDINENWEGYKERYFRRMKA